MFSATFILLAIAAGPFALMLYLAQQQQAELKPVRIKTQARRRR